jgi:RNA polymerase sigma factor (sigma-70 family)
MERLDDLDDAELLAATASRPEAFAVFYRRHVGTVLAYCRRRTPGTEVAFDLCAEVFAAALEGAGRYRRAHDTAAPWLYGIARNKLADSARRGRIEDAGRRRLAMQPIEIDDEGIALLEEAAPLLAGLPADEREAVRARVVDERGYGEIATALRCSEQVVRKRVSRGLARLRAKMEAER